MLLMIPPKFLEYAGIQKDVHIVGAYNRIEVWDPKTREQYIQEIESSGIDLEEKIETIITILGLLGACALLAWIFFPTLFH